MDPNHSSRTPSPRLDRQGRWRAVVSGQRRGPAASLARFGLALLELLYRLGLGVANLRFLLPGAVRRAPCPVISVGNLTVGGTGKTPMVAYLARAVVGLGGRPLIVSRGYGAAAGQVNEEARELERLCPGVPHVQDADRWRAIRDAAAARPCDVAILDDGFQHRRLARDLDIVLVDALAPFGYGHLLPRGLLREPVSALRRADLVVITRADLAGEAEAARLRQSLEARVRPGTPILLAAHRPTGFLRPDGSVQPPEHLRGRDIAAACAIAHPEAFRRTLEGLGARVQRFDAFRDHHAYTRADVDGLIGAAQAAGLKTLVTTGKDYVKWLPLLAGRPGALPLEVGAVGVALEIVEGEEALRRAVAALLPGSAAPGDR